jgi:uncharacterized membrane protein
MKNRYLLLCILVVLASLGATALMAGHLPARVPIHWNGAGEVNGYGPRGWLFANVGIMALIVALWVVLPRLSPRHFTVDEFRATWWQVGLIVVALLAYNQGLMLWAAGTRSGTLPHALLGGLGIFVALLGNVMGKVRRNFWLGIRTPWTLASERVWYATHRLAAKSMVATGLLAFLAVLAQLPVAVAIGLVMAGVLVPAIWSLVYYKQLERGGRLEA